MEDNQARLSNAQANMENMEAELIENSDEANEINEDANKKIEEQKTEFDMYKASYQALKAKVENGEPLTEDEKTLYKECCKYMADIGEGITDIQETTTETVGEIYDDMDTYQDGYDEAAETMGEVEGITDFAESFDSTTRTMCFVEAGAQALNAASGGKASAKAFKIATATCLFGGSALYYAAGVAGALGAARSTLGSLEQLSYAKDVGQEIDKRTDTQDLNAATMDFYDESTDNYAGWMQGVEDLELEIPDDLEVPDSSPPLPSDVYPQDTPDTIKSKKEDKES